MKFLKEYFLYLVIGILLVMLLMSRCNKSSPVAPDPIVTRDTIWIHRVDTIYTKPKVVMSTPDTVYEEKWIPNPDYDKLKQQYKDLLTLYFNTHVVKDTLKIDSIGHVYVTDWVYKNQIESRKYTYDLSRYTIKESITLPAKLRNQLYIGGSLQGNFINPINQVTAGLLLKNKKDQIFGAYTGINKDAEWVLGVQSYWKIHIGK